MHFSIEQAAVVIAAYFVFSSFVDALLPPLPGKERGTYGTFYRFMQNMAANASRAMAAKYPQYAHPADAEAHLTETDTVVREHTIAATSGKGN